MIADRLDLAAIPIVDQHAHNLARPDLITPEAYLGAFTESPAPEIVNEQVRDTLSFRRSIREVTAVFGCPPNVDEVLAARERWGFDRVAREFFGRAGLEAVWLDDGFRPDEVLPIGWHDRFVPTRRILRIERLAESIIAEQPTWTRFAEAFVDALRRLAAEVVAFKSIVAYRTGLAVRPDPDATAAADCFQALRSRAVAGHRVRLARAPLNDWVVVTALRVAAERSLPVQVHRGFGDPDLDLRAANPLHLRPLLEHPALGRVRVVLLHAAYPFAREAGFLAASYPRVAVDLGLAFPLLSTAGLRSVCRQLFELAPLSKILYSSDGHVIPELFYLAAQAARRVIADVLGEAIRDGDLTLAGAEAVAAGILRDNAIRWYGASAAGTTPSVR